MFRKLVCAMFVMTLAVGLVGAEEFTAIIKKVDGDKVTFAKFDFKNFKKDKDAKPEEMTLPAAKDAKITKGKFNKEDKKFEVGEAIENGLKNDMFTKIEEKKEKGKGFFGGGLFARITTSDDGKTITAINITQFGGKGKKDDKKTDK